ncbi:hypothetical protein KC343_g10760 [Hortaea werneckii]|uniref:Uncharacterized protein n=1 Tax=Hortaea werneckii TaxID=91943 RepID=A0A3M7ETT5_HORWE|nr:hypothetical protein KC352_g27792 [Hortaea werneckii]KAI7606156.1 hypothetical protein KC346_g10683 [Hortaea werneckii]KAI7613749.1 hypothetical protein KC343_g10760 [Hortaea werneckii]KAI7693433.1 hypothetical protein KC322_g10739 [Hortaea werneckii]RMY79903.1 hypothetical protein D0864_08892 [Hortaea werneckii]
MASSDNNRSAAIQHVHSHTHPAPQRRVLGDVSPNVKLASSAIGLLKNGKPMASSPLKRSYTASFDHGAGLKYLKRRRLSEDEALSEQVESTGQDTRRSSGSVFGGNRSASVGDAPEADLGTGQLHIEQQERTHSVPVIQEQYEPMIPTVQQESPTEPNTPTSSGDEPQQHSSAERHSFSSLINYDPSSQVSYSNNHNATANINAAISATIEHQSSIPGLSRAQLLKLRLRVAMYKVQTNQTHLPFESLTHAGRDVDGRATSEAVEEAVAQIKREAYLKQEQQRQRQAEQETTNPSTDQPVPRLLPAPVLKPTAYSSRQVVYEEADPPSSPPASESTARRGSELHHQTPTQLPGCTGSADAPQSDDIENIDDVSTQLPGGDRGEQTNLSNSIDKGRVAEGLLGLRNSS